MLETAWTDECQSLTYFLDMYKNTCPGLFRFWRRSYATRFTGIPGLCIWDWYPVTQFRRTSIFSKSWYSHVKDITRSWMKCDSPKTRTVVGHYRGNLFHEKLTHYIRTKAGTHEQRWRKWTAYKRKDELCTQLVWKIKGCKERVATPLIYLYLYFYFYSSLMSLCCGFYSV